MKNFLKGLFTKSKSNIEQSIIVNNEESIPQKPMINQQVLTKFLREIDPQIEDLDFDEVFKILKTSPNKEALIKCLINIIEKADSLYNLLKYDRWDNKKEIPELQSALRSQTLCVLSSKFDVEELIRLLYKYDYGIVDFLIRQRIAELKSDLISKANVKELIELKKITRNCPLIEKRMEELVSKILPTISLSNINDAEILWAHSSRGSKSRELIDARIKNLFSKMSNMSALKKLADICNNSTSINDFSYVEIMASHKAWQILSSVEDLKILKKLKRNLPYCHMIGIYVSNRAIEIIKKTEFTFRDFEDLLSYKNAWYYTNTEVFEKILSQLLAENLKNMNDISKLILYWSESAPRNLELTNLVRNRISQLFSDMNYKDFKSLIARKPPEEFKDVFRKKAEELITLLNKQ